MEDSPRIHDSGHPQRYSDNDFKDRITFMSMFNGIEWDAIGNA